MPEYITRPGGHDTTYVGPYQSTGASIRLYVLEGEFAKLKKTLDRYLKPVAPSDTLFLPLGDKFLGSFAAMDKVEGGNATLGYMREIDVSFLIPALRVDKLIPKGIVLFAPYLFVDIPQAAANGREVHGYRKEVGTSFSQTDTYADAWVANAADLTHIDAWAIAKSGDRLKQQRLIDVTVPGAGGGTPWPDLVTAITDIVAELTKDLTDLVGGLGGGMTDAALRLVLQGLVAALFGQGDVPLTSVFLRQFRNPRHTVYADVQQLVSAKSHISLAGFTAQKLPAGYQVTFNDMASHPFATELGVTSGTPTASSLTAECRCSFSLEEAD